MIDITAVIVSYNRADLLKRSFESIRKFSDMPVIIIDGSSSDNPCNDYSRTLLSHNTFVINTRSNIGHGAGMDLGIKKVDTNLVLLMDSDAEIIDGQIVEVMEFMLNKNPLAFGVGQVVTVNEGGTNVRDTYPGAIKYLHPHFAMIRKSIYDKIPGFVHHGAPCIKSMIYLNTFKKFELCSISNLHKFVKHEGRGTRSLNPPEFLQNWK